MSGFPEERPEELTAQGPEETGEAGRRLARGLLPGDLILVSGEVGAGKSTLIRAAMRELGVKGPIPSPTFTIGRRYEDPDQKFPVSHLDLYRLGPLEDEDPGLLSGYFGSDQATFVEWPGDTAGELASMATRTVRVAIEHVDRESRRIRLETPY